MSEEKQPAPEITGEELTENEPPEKEIDLNSIFPDADTDLNALFPDIEIKTLLKKINKDKKDLHSLKARFLMENETADDAKDQEV